jgi:3-dehydroquinate dehydratase-2
MILLVNGPNLNLLGEREPQVYGATTLAEIERMVRDTCAPYGLEVQAIQSNHEGTLVDFLQEHRQEAEGVIANLGAFTHSSYALHDCIRSLSCPTIEVHISNIYAREEWRHRSVIAPVVRGQISGLGTMGYYLAATYLCSEISQANAAGSDDSAEPAPTGAYE